MTKSEHTRNTPRLYENHQGFYKRVDLHHAHSTNSTPLHEWLGGLINLTANAKILEIGTGAGDLAQELCRRFPTCQILATDISSNALDKLRSESWVNTYDIQFAVCDMHDLQFAPRSFDVVLANHVLYYSKDVGHVVGEIARILAPGGVLFAATNGEDNLIELARFHQKALGCPDLPKNPLTNFTLENGEKILSKYFPHVERVLREDSLVFSDHQPLMAYYETGWINREADGTHNFDLSPEEREKRRLIVQEEAKRTIASQGKLVLKKSVGAFIARME